jgi:extracellular matrix protein 14
MKPFSYAFVALSFLLSANSVSAVPAGSSINRPLPVQPLSIFDQKQPSLGLWTRFRDSIIETIWGLPEGLPNVRNLKDRVGSAPAKALSRYGSDVVLRFQVRDSEEAQALSEAVHILFLDVWASVDGLIDIRVAQEVVSSFQVIIPRIWC